MIPPPESLHRTATVDEVFALIRAHIQPLDAERVPLAEAGGRVLREPVCALEDQPPFDRSSVDGYAVRLDDAATQFRLVDNIRAGDWKPRALQPGETVRIGTGGALPGDGLGVLMEEDVRVDGRKIVPLRRDSARNIRFRGEDARAGSEVIAAGTLLGPGALALLASLGCVNPPVTRRPRALHLATGNEIIPPAQAPRPGQIRDSNSVLVRAFLGQWGVEPTQLRVAEDAAPIHDALRDPLSVKPPPDLLLISGGASVGEHDCTRRLLQEFGFDIHVSRTTTRPGKPLIFAARGPVAAFGLPGNPLAHFVCLNLYVHAALEMLCGRPAGPPFLRGELAQPLPAEANARETLWPARLEWAAGGGRLTPLPWRSSGDLTALATANALVRIPPGCGTLARDTSVEFAPTATFT